MCKQNKLVIGRLWISIGKFCLIDICHDNRRLVRMVFFPELDLLAHICIDFENYPVARAFPHVAEGASQASDIKAQTVAGPGWSD